VSALSCPHRPPCPGCPRFGEAKPPDRARRLLDAWARTHALPSPAFVTGAPSGFRHRARLMVRGRTGAPRIGLFQEGSHRIADIPRCPIHHPAINEVAARTRQAMRECAVAPYADRPHRGALRTLQVVVERWSGRVQVTLVGNDTSPDPLAGIAEHLQRALGERLQGLFWNGNPERTNTLLGSHWHRWSGAESSVEIVAGARIHSPPGAFGQSHPEMAERIALAVQARVPDGARVAELYAGCGSLSLGLLPRIARLHLNEVNPHGLRGLDLGLAERPDTERERTVCWPGPAADALGALDEADVVIVDPPRKGLDAPVCAALAAGRSDLLLYVSCGLDSLLRDAEVLAEGGWRPTAITAFDAFPYTEHVETLAVFARAHGRAPQA